MDLVINGCRIWSSNKWLHLSQKRDEAWSQLNVNVHILRNSSDIRRSFSNNTAQAHTTCRSGNSTWHLFEQLWSSKSPSLVHARDTSVVAEASLCRHQSIPGSLDIQTYPNPTTIFIYFPRFHFGGGQLGWECLSSGFSSTASGCEPVDGLCWKLLAFDGFRASLLSFLPGNLRCRA